MHKYYEDNRAKLKRKMYSYFRYIDKELSSKSNEDISNVLEEIWLFYETKILEHLPYIGGDTVSGTEHMVDAYFFVAMGEVMKGYGMSLEEIGYLMTLCSERKLFSTPKPVRKIIGRLLKSPKILKSIYAKKDIKNEENAKLNPGSFETKVMEVPEEGYDFSYHNFVCPIAEFAKEHNYSEYMPYLCNLDYIMFGAYGVPLYREQTIAGGGDYCDFKLKLGAEVLKAWPPVFSQDRGLK